MFAGGKLFTVPMAVEDIGSDAYTNGIETLEALTGSAVRLRVLGLLLERGSVTASDIEPNVDVSRRTVTRALSALEEQQFAASNGRTYHPTTYAELVADDIFELLARLERGREVASFLEVFPSEAVDFPACHLVDADGTVVHRQSAAPHAPVSHVTDALDGAQHVRILAPIASPVYVRPVVARVRDGAAVEAVIDADAYDSFCTKLHSSVRLASTLADVSLSVHDDIPFGLLKCDERVVLGAYEDGVLQATFETDDQRVRNTAQKVYDQYRAASDRVVG